MGNLGSRILKGLVTVKSIKVDRATDGDELEVSIKENGQQTRLTGKEAEQWLVENPEYQTPKSSRLNFVEELSQAPDEAGAYEEINIRIISLFNGKQKIKLSLKEGEEKSVLRGEAAREWIRNHPEEGYLISKDGKVVESDSGLDL